MLRSLFVQAAGRAVASLVECSRHVVSFAQSVFHVAHAPRGLILARAHAGRALEKALQIERTRPGAFAELRQRHDTFRLVQDLARAYYDLRLRGDLCRLTAQAGAVSGLFCLLRVGEKLHRIPSRPTAGTRRTAVNARRAHSKNESPVLPGIASHYLLPLLFGLHVANLAP